ncbi:RNA polymerase II transcription mediator complex subunit 9-domain-containing protein [Dipodascopsis uninucleata]
MANTTTDTSTDSITKSQSGLESQHSILHYSSFTFLPDLLDLLDRVSAGTLSPKDLDNEAGRLRIKIQRARNLLESLPDVHVSNIDEQMVKISELKKKIERKKDLLLKVTTISRGVVEGDSYIHCGDFADEDEKAKIKGSMNSKENIGDDGIRDMFDQSADNAKQVLGESKPEMMELDEQLDGLKSGNVPGANDSELVASEVNGKVNADMTVSEPKREISEEVEMREFMQMMETNSEQNDRRLVASDVNAISGNLQRAMNEDSVPDFNIEITELSHGEDELVEGDYKSRDNVIDDSKNDNNVQEDIHNEEDIEGRQNYGSNEAMSPIPTESTELTRAESDLGKPVSASDATDNQIKNYDNKNSEEKSKESDEIDDQMMEMDSS